MFKFLRAIPGGLAPNRPGSWLLFHNKTDKHIRFTWGDDLFYASADDPDDLRGPTIKDWWIDEIGLVGKVAFEIMQGRLIATGGRGLSTGTPKGIEFLGGIEEKARARPERYSWHQWSSYDNPGADPEILEELSEDWTEDFKRQELYGELVEWGDAPIGYEYIKAAWRKNLTFIEKGRRDHQYLNVWDLARKRDWTVGGTLDLTADPVALVAWERFQKRPWPEVARLIELRHEKFPGATMVDSTGVGDPLAQFLKIPESQLVEFIFSGKSKYQAIQALIVELENSRLAWPHPSVEPDMAQLNRELRFYRWDDKSLVQDCVMMMAMGAYQLGQPPVEILVGRA